MNMIFKWLPFPESRLFFPPPPPPSPPPPGFSLNFPGELQPPHPHPWVWLGVRAPAAMILHQALAPLLARALHILLAVIAFQFSFEMLSLAEHMAIFWLLSRGLDRRGVKRPETRRHSLRTLWPALQSGRAAPGRDVHNRHNYTTLSEHFPPWWMARAVL